MLIDDKPKNKSTPEHLLFPEDNNYGEGDYSDNIHLNDIGLRNNTMIKRAANLFDENYIHNNRFNKFARYGLLDPYNAIHGVREYLFFTKPDLHIFDTKSTFKLYEPLSKSDFFSHALASNPESLLSLQQTFNTTNRSAYPNQFNPASLYMPILTNQVASSLELPDIVATETGNNTNLYQITTTYRDSSEISDNQFEFTLEFLDTKYLDVYMLFKAYDEFCREEFRRQIRPTKYSYIEDMVNSKQFSIFKIVVDDLDNILYYGKVIGVYPLNVPRSSLSNIESGPLRLNISFKGQFVQDSRPIFLKEINNLTAVSLNIKPATLDLAMGNDDTRSKLLLSQYDMENSVPNTEWGMYPYIYKTKMKRIGGSNADGDLYSLGWINESNINLL